MIILARADGNTLGEVSLQHILLLHKFKLIFVIIFQRIKNSLIPHIYECKVCGEHHCDHIDDAIVSQL